MHCSWAVIYKDGSMMDQRDKISKHYIAESDEIPYRAINWPQVSQLKLTSQLCEQTFDLVDPPEGIQVSLRSRMFLTITRLEVMCMMLVLSEAGKEVSAETAKSILYWFPDGVTHECSHFNCPDVGNYAHKILRDQPVSLMPATQTIQTEVSAIVE